LLNLIQLKTDTVSFSRYLNEPKIYFNGEQLNAGRNPTVLHEEVSDGVTVQLGKGDRLKLALPIQCYGHLF
jgi:hypothetical protein